MKQLAVIIGVLLCTITLPGCSEYKETRKGNFGLDTWDDVGTTAYGTIRWGTQVGTYSSVIGEMAAFDCDAYDPRNPHLPDPEWVKITVHDKPIEDGSGNTLFVGNWTGIQCNHQYVFRYKAPGVGELYEATYPDREKIRDMPTAAP